MSFLGPSIYLANKHEFRKRLKEKDEFVELSTTQSYQTINSYQNNQLFQEGYITKINARHCFIITDNKDKLVIIKDVNKIYSINQRILVTKNLSKLPYSKNKFLCFSEKYYYANEVWDRAKLTTGKVCL
jgi:hypothetical protein